MEYCIIIRGPAGIGKTTISKELAKAIDAKYFSFDKIMKDNKLDDIVGDGIAAENFVKANEIILSEMKKHKRVVLDGCFYRKKQMEHLLHKLSSKVFIFTLLADITECHKRNLSRKNPLSKENVKQVYDLVCKLKVGTDIRVRNKEVHTVVSEIISHIN